MVDFPLLKISLAINQPIGESKNKIDSIVSEIKVENSTIPKLNSRERERLFKFKQSNNQH